jgi:hypothetical protein
VLHSIQRFKAPNHKEDGVNTIARVVAFVLIGLSISASAEATEIYINGVRVGAVAGVEMSGCEVRFDAQGNIHITAPGYEVVAPPPQEALDRPSVGLVGNYFLLVESTPVGETPYQLNLILNGEPFREITASQNGLVISLNETLLVGKNKLTIQAKRIDEAAYVPDASFQVFIGPGEGSAVGAKIRERWVEYKRTGKDRRASYSDTFTIVAQ